MLHLAMIRATCIKAKLQDKLVEKLKSVQRLSPGRRHIQVPFGLKIISEWKHIDFSEMAVM